MFNQLNYKSIAKKRKLYRKLNLISTPMRENKVIKKGLLKNLVLSSINAYNNLIFVKIFVLNQKDELYQSFSWRDRK